MKTRTGQRERDKAARQADCETRASEWSKLSPSQKLQALDDRLGEGVGAKRQRERLLVEIVAKAKPLEHVSLEQLKKIKVSEHSAKTK